MGVLQAAAPQKELSHQDYLHDPNNLPRPLLKRRTVGLQELTAGAGQQPSQPSSKTSEAARTVSLATETAEDKEAREEVQVGHRPYVLSVSCIYVCLFAVRHNGVHHEFCVDKSNYVMVHCQARLPGREWRERHGAAGVPSDERRGSPIVELSLLLVRCMPFYNFIALQLLCTERSIFN